MRRVATPLMDSVGPMSYAAVDGIHMDPTEPMPAVMRGGVLHSMPDELVDTLLGVAGPDVEVPLAMVELRLMGGALGRPAEVPNAVAGREGAFSLSVVAPAPPPLVATAHAVTGGVLRALEPWSPGTTLVNFAGHGTTRRRAGRGRRTSSSGSAGSRRPSTPTTCSAATSALPSSRRVRDDPARRRHRTGAWTPRRQRRVPRPHRRHAVLQPGDRGAPAGPGVSSHVHEVEDDSFLVLEGTLSLVVGDDDRKVRADAGTFVLVPAGTAHSIANDGTDDVRLLNVHAPGGFDRRIGLR